ncbi:MAG: DinB family protein [Chitinophagaceae bacterium]|nr:MAG: DinB family protein [Chitinophagaceae bacterium]
MHDKLTRPTQQLLSQLHRFLLDLTDEQYSIPLPVLSNASIGQHARHVIEFYQELAKSYTTGSLDYDQRKRDRRIETERLFALEQISHLKQQVNQPDKTLLLTADLEKEDGYSLTLTTSYYRELISNLEHTVHHMALMRIGYKAVAGQALDENFGVAVSTIKSRSACAQ